MKKLLVVDVAALGWDLVAQRAPDEGGLTFHKAEAVFPAVTCTAQASFRTASPPSVHGMIGNGLFFRDLRKALFWEQAASLVGGERIWKSFRARGGRVGMLFWQQSLGEDADLVLSPKPVHKHSGGMIQDCYSQPHDLYARLCIELGRPFNLMHYWGPLASRKSSEWIADATAAIMSQGPHAPELLFSYLPHLDYDLQRYGPGSPQAKRALDDLLRLLNQLRSAAERNGYEVLFFGDYAIERVERGAIFPNRALREAGLFKVRTVKRMAYPDFFASDAFAMADHGIAHVFATNEAALCRARDVLARVPGIAEICDSARQEALGIRHPNCGELALIAEKGAWFAYPWWTDRREAPDYAAHIDIHNKPGYDPCELFFGLPRVSRGWPLLSVSQDASRIRGTHGRAGPEAPIAWASSCRFETRPRTLLELSAAVARWLGA